jgi:hypothetical protein
MIGRIEKVDLREIWKNEAKDFTTWLSENLEVLSEVLGSNLTLVEREKSVGSFNVDILAEDENGNSVVIENQLEKSDHDHLGKLLTYSINLEAKTAIWITPEPRQEHINVITWLNETTENQFYLLKIEALKIGDSLPAPLFQAVAVPTAEGKEIGSEKKELAQRHIKRKAFWESLLDLCNTKTKLFSGISSNIENWISTGIGLAGIALHFSITNDYGTVSLYIDKGKGFDELNKKRFDLLFAEKSSIEEELGTNLIWDRLDSCRSSRIHKRFDDSGLLTEEKWPVLQEQMINFMINFKRCLERFIKDLRNIN